MARLNLPIHPVLFAQGWRGFCVRVMSVKKSVIRLFLVCISVSPKSLHLRPRQDSHGLAECVTVRYTCCKAGPSGQKGGCCKAGPSGRKGGCCKAGPSGQKGGCCKAGPSGQKGGCCKAGPSGQKGGCCAQLPRSSWAVWKSRWPSWAPVPNKPTVSVDVKQHSTNSAPSELRRCVKVEVDVLGSRP